MESRRRKLIIIISISIVIVVGTIIPIVYFIFFGSFNTQELGQIYTGGSAFDLEVQGDIAYVLDTADNNPGGLIIINVSNPYHPYKLGSFYQSGLPIALEVVGNIAYLANTFVGLEVLNLSDPTNPIKIDQYTGSSEIYDVQVVGNIAYIADWYNGLVLLNVSDPSDLTPINSFPLSGACIHLHVENNMAFITEHFSSYTAIRIINISNPHSLVQLGYYAPSNIDFWNPLVVNDKIYVANHGLNGEDFFILDAGDPSNLNQLSVFNNDGTIFNYFVDGNTLFFADYQKGLIVVDYSDFSAPRIVGRHYDGGHAYDVEVVGNIAYVADNEDGLEIIKILI